MKPVMKSGQNGPPGFQEGDLPESLAQPALRALRAAGFERLSQLAQVREADLKPLHGIGVKAIDQLRHALAEKGLSFRQDERKAEG